MGHYVYKYVYNNEIMYIGKNDTNLETRINQHKLEGKFKPYLNSDIYYIELANSVMSDVVESELIRRYKPKLNVAKMSNWTGLNFVEPEWKIFTPKDQKKHLKIKRNYDRSMCRKMKTYELMSQYYCMKLLENISDAKETELFFEIEVLIAPDDNKYEHCVCPYIEVKDNDSYAGLSLGCCYSNDGISIIYRFMKESLFVKFKNIETGLRPRVQYMQNMFKEKMMNGIK